MKLAVLSFNALGETPPGLARQVTNFAVETVQAATGQEIGRANFIAQLPDQPGRMAFMNLGDSMFALEQLKQFHEHSGAELIMDGSLEQTSGKYLLTIRAHAKENEEPIFAEQKEFAAAELFPNLTWFVQTVARFADAKLPAELAEGKMDFGTDNPQAFIDFLLGTDALSYIQQTNGMVANEFSPEDALASLLQAIKLDADFESPYLVLVQLCRACAASQIGEFEMLRSALTKATELEPDDFNAWFGLGEIHERYGDLLKAAEYFEKAVQLGPEEPSLLARLGIVQMNSGMPVNAERNFRKALELEGDQKPSLDLLAGVLQATGREHEIPTLWREQTERNPQDASARAKYAVSLMQAGRTDDAKKVLDDALEALEDNTIIKRYYAPMLAQAGDLDRAMDFYEDCIDVAPNDIQLLMEYAQTLQAAGRDFEIPEVLKSVLGSNPDPNTRAHAMAWMIEIEQPKRAENVESARLRIDAEDYEGAVQILKPLRNWLADYWKLWGMLASAYNHLEQYPEAEDAARRLLNLFPACEPAYGELRQALAMQGKNEEAYNVLRFAASNMPSSLPIHVNLGLAARQAGHEDEAKELAKRIREVVGPNEELEPVLAEMEGLVTSP